MDFSIRDDASLQIFRISLGSDLLITASYKQANRIKVLEIIQKFMFAYEKFMR